MNFSIDWFKTRLLDRLVRYARINTTSDPHADSTPSTPGQWDLLNLLVKELDSIGVKDVELTEAGYLIARLPATAGCETSPVVGFMAHVDTSFDAPGENVNPQVHPDYSGEKIELKNGVVLDPKSDPDLAERKGDTIITTDGTTLLGADDKAGIAEIVTAVEWLLAHPEEKHGAVEIVFTPDEETGRGMNGFPKEKLKSSCCYTLDGDVAGTIEAECFNAEIATIVFKGVPTHPGTARGILVNAVGMAAGFVSMLPRNESPEATDERYGYYFPHEISGNADEARLIVLLRDFEGEGLRRRREALESFARAVEAQYPGGRVTVGSVKQYANMRNYFENEPRAIGFLEEAVRRTGLTPVVKIIRGGTDGARLSEMGIPTPNFFTGGHSYHSRSEWAALGVMVSACEVVIHLASLWGEAS